ncbi:FAD-dependent oxidoreductase [Paraburkholderia sp. BCC1876]|uniref:FAD-dependent oxidoreductase n=1 Tax=Paraburkholderia sp. BCC1876 TaxID=2676303 RepID=UPI0015901884|nr:FAD-dependent oxidoreductase [Paraburkholderia sp. BCC1876]
MRPFWLEQALRGEAADAPALQGTVNADVCIVGGGFTGLWTALQLKRANPHLDVVLIEADICGAGASGRNGGCMLTWETRFLTLLRLFGESEARRLVEASRQAVGKIADFCREHRIDAQMRVDGTLYTATSAAQMGSLEAVVAALEERGMSSFSGLDVDEVHRRAGSKRHLAGDFSPAAATVQPALLVRGLRRVALEMGVRLYEKTPFEALSYAPGPLVRTTCGAIRAKRVVLAINAWMAQTFKQFERSIALVSSDMIITERAPDLLERVGLTDGLSVLDSRTFVYYYRTTPDGRLMLGKGGNTFAYGGRVLPVFDQPSPYRAALTDDLGRFFPALAAVPITASWNGPSDRSATGLPFFGRLDGRHDVFYGFGYSGNGVGPSYMGGEILSSLVLGLDNAWTRSPIVRGPRGVFPPEPIRYLGSLVVRDAIRRKERAEDAGATPWFFDRALSRLAQAAGKADKA